MRLFFENVNSLGVFTTGKSKLCKLNQKMRYLIRKYDIDIAAFVETMVDWRQVRQEGSAFEHLFTRSGEDKRCVTLYNVTTETIETECCQRGRTVILTRGRMSASVKQVKANESDLGRFCWTKVGGAGKMTYVMTVYMPHNREKDETKGLTVWDQQKIPYGSEGLMEKESCQTLFDDVVAKLLEWKTEDCEIILTGDFNQDVYQDDFARRLAEEDVNMTEQFLKTTGKEIPPTHDRGRRSVCGVYATAGVECKAAEVLFRGSGMGDHLVFLLDFCTKSVLRDKCPRVVPAPGRILRCDVHAFRTKYIKVLEQLVARHSMCKSWSK